MHQKITTSTCDADKNACFVEEGLGHALMKVVL